MSMFVGEKRLAPRLFTSTIGEAPLRRIGSEINRSRTGPIVQYIFSALLVLIASFAAEVLLRSVEMDRNSAIFLAPVLMSGVWYGVRPALFAAFLSFLIHTWFFVEPRLQPQVSDPEIWLDFALYLGVGYLTGRLAGRLRDEIAEAEHRASILETLSDASARMSVLTSEEELLRHIEEAMAKICGAPTAIFREGKVDAGPLGRMGQADAARVVELAGHAFRSGQLQTFSDGPWRARPLLILDQPIAVAVWRGGGEGGGRDVDQLVGILSDRGAGTTARIRLLAVNAEVATASKMEKLRTALLSSLSHDFRTPLSAILASASSLVDYGEQFTPEVRKDLLLNIQAEAESLKDFVSNLLSMTRLENGAIVLDPIRIRPIELVHDVAERLERRSGHSRIRVVEAGEPAFAVADPQLFSQALTNVLDNALRYSPKDSPIDVSVRRSGARTLVSVADQGPGVSRQDRSRIFDKFYRAHDKDASGGSGLGLSIAKGLVEAMDGTIAAAGGRVGGLVITLSLPGAVCATSD